MNIPYVLARAGEAAPPLLFPERGPGYRPSLTEDPPPERLWKCSIGGRNDGLLAGKTVSFKDHFSVAGIPQVSPRRSWRASSPTWTRPW